MGRDMTKRGDPKRAQGPPRSKLTVQDVLARLISDGLPDEGIWWTYDLEPGQEVEPGFDRKGRTKLTQMFGEHRTWIVEISAKKVHVRWTASK